MQPVSPIRRSHVVLAVECLANYTALVTAIVGVLGQVQATYLYGVGVGALGVATLCNFQRGHFILRRVELGVQAFQMCGALLAMGLTQYSVLPMRIFSPTLLAIMCISIPITAMQFYVYASRRTLQNNTEGKEIRVSQTRALYWSRPHHQPKEVPEEITIESWNTALMIDKLSRMFSKMRKPIDRVKEIGAALTTGDLPDVLCLQECFSSDATEILINKYLKKHYPYIIYAVAPLHGKVGLDSGLLIASKYPITNATFAPFVTVGEDQFAQKGIVKVQIGHITLCNTHLGSAGGDGPRLEQVKVISKFVESNAIIVGDFNLPTDRFHIQGHQILRNDTGTFYKFSQPGWKHNQAKARVLQKDGRVIDHIIVPMDIEAEAVQVIAAAPEQFLPSDHLRLRVKVTVPKRAHEADEQEEEKRPR